MYIRRYLRDAIVSVAITVAIVLVLAVGARYLERAYPTLNLTSAPE